MTNEANDALFKSNILPWPKNEFQRWGMALARNYDLERKEIAEAEKAQAAAMPCITSNLTDTPSGGHH